MRIISKGNIFKDILWDIEIFFRRNIKDNLYYLFNRKKIKEKLSEEQHVKHIQGLRSFGIKKNIDLYHHIRLGEDLATFKGYNSYNDLIRAGYGEVESLKKLGVSI